LEEAKSARKQEVAATTALARQGHRPSADGATSKDACSATSTVSFLEFWELDQTNEATVTPEMEELTRQVLDAARAAFDGWAPEAEKGCMHAPKEPKELENVLTEHKHMYCRELTRQLAFVPRTESDEACEELATYITAGHSCLTAVNQEAWNRKHSWLRWLVEERWLVERAPMFVVMLCLWFVVAFNHVTSFFGVSI
jgi:hypothetical protein